VLTACTRQELPRDVRDSLRQSVTFVEGFEKAKARLPERNEFQAWQSTNVLNGIADYEIVGTTNKFYRIYTWLGERAMIYSSDDKSVKPPSILNREE